MKYNTVLPIQEQRIRFANVTIFIRKDGRIIVRQRYNDAGKGIRTPERLEAWVRWANVLNEYRALESLLQSMFAERKAYRTACNEFISLNYRKSQTCLTQKEAALGATVFEPGLIVSNGNTELVAPISVTLEEERLVSNIRVADDFVIDADTTIADFTSQVLQYNKPRIKTGDTLFFLRATQGYNAQLQIPVGESQWYRCDLDPADTRKLKEVVGTDGFLSEMVGGRRVLTAPADADSMGTWIHGTKVKGRFLSSAQSLVGSNSRMASYISLEAKKKAMLSYGGANTENVLNPATPVLTWEEVNNGATPGAGTGNTDPTTPGGGGPGVVHEVTVTCTVQGGHGTVNPASHTVTFGSNITFTAAPDEGYRPDWPNGSHDLTYSLQARESTNITLTFSPKTSGGNQGDDNDYGS